MKNYLPLFEETEETAKKAGLNTSDCRVRNLIGSAIQNSIIFFNTGSFDITPGYYNIFNTVSKYREKGLDSLKDQE